MASTPAPLSACLDMEERWTYHIIVHTRRDICCQETVSWHGGQVVSGVSARFKSEDRAAISTSQPVTSPGASTSLLRRKR